MVIIWVSSLCVRYRVPSFIKFLLQTMSTERRLLLLLILLATVSLYLWYSQISPQYSIPNATIIQSSQGNQTLVKSLIDEITLLKKRLDHLEGINDVSEIKNNDKQYIIDKTETGDAMKGAVVILGCDRPNNLNLSLYSIYESKRRSTIIDIHDLPIFVSIDCNHNTTINIARAWSNIMNVKVLLSKSINHIARSPRAITLKIKNHWLHTINRLFKEFAFDYVIYLEDDHIVSPDFFDTAHVLISYVLNGYFKKDTSQEIFTISLGQHQKTPFDSFPNDRNRLFKVKMFNLTSNIAVVYLKQEWLKFMKYIDRFCAIRDGWDISLASLKWTTPSISNFTLFVSKTRAYHLRGGCYSSRTKLKHKVKVGVWCDPNITIEQEYHSFVNSFNRDIWYKLESETQVELTGYEYWYTPEGAIPNTDDNNTIQRCLQCARIH